jgi:ABC-type multidrug transport system fused ATPase/permease subunit
MTLSVVPRRLSDRPEWQFFAALPKAAPGLAAVWWLVLVLRGVLPAALAVATGLLVRSVSQSDALVTPLALVCVIFVAMQVLSPLHEVISANLGDRLSAWLYERLMNSCVDPPGLGHLENPDLTDDLTVSRDFDTGMLGPPLFFSMGFIAEGLVGMLVGVASAVVLAFYTWWAAVLLTLVWLSTHWILRRSAGWHGRDDPEVREAQRHSDYTYRLAVDPPGAKDLRLFGLVGWTVERFLANRRRLHELQFRATRMRRGPLLVAVPLVLAANLAVYLSLADRTADGQLSLDRAVIFTQAAFGVSVIAFSGLNWAVQGASAAVTASMRLSPAMAPAGALADPPSGHVRPADELPSTEIRCRDVSFSYPVSTTPVLDGFDLTIPAGRSLAIVGLNGAGKTTLAKLLCRLYDPASGRIEVGGVDLRDLDVDSWRRRLTAAFQDFVRLELPLRDNVAPNGAPDEVILAALADAGAAGVADLDTPLAKGYPGGTDLSGGQWQRVALARVLCGVRMGADVVILDEPTAHLDVRGEAEIFRRLLDGTRHCTTLLISHRFSTVRHADLICVMEGGTIVETGTHEELMALEGRYRRMFDLQARRFDEEGEDGEDGGDEDQLSAEQHGRDEEVAYDVLR